MPNVINDIEIQSLFLNSNEKLKHWLRLVEVEAIYVPSGIIKIKHNQQNIEIKVSPYYT